MFDSWTFKMAWRDSRGSRKRLFIFLSSMVLGVAALVAINSFGVNLERAVDEQAKALLGADLSFESNAAFPDTIEVLIDSLGGDQSRRISFSSMAYFPRTNDTRLSMVRAIEGAYPYYGAVETNPPEAAQTYLNGPNALLDGTLMQQFGVQVGDSVRIGTRSYQVAGRLLKTPRETGAAMLFSPRIYIPLAHLDSTLLQMGSRADYEVYFKFNDGRDAEALRESLEDRLREQRVGSDTVEEIQENWNENLTNLYRFLSLVGFVALLLGGLGVASAVHVYVKQRIATVAVLRCVGAKSWRTFGIYVIQAAGMGIVGATLGCLVGIGIQMLIPQVLSDFLPVEVDFVISWGSVLLGFGIGLGVTLLFALKPLISVRNVSPLLALRATIDPNSTPREPLNWLIYAIIGIGIVLFAIIQAPNAQFGAFYALGIAVVFGLLALVARLIIYLSRKYFPSSWTYVWRQGLANLYRPNNQTLILMLAVGLGTFLILTLFLVQQTLLDQVQLAAGEGQPNLVLYDIQSDQLDGLTNLVEEQSLPVMDAVPIVTMRIAEVNGRTVEEIRADTTSGEFSWAHRREYRSSYRDYLTDSETLLEGEFIGDMSENSDLIPVSVERDILENLKVEMGDTIVFNVQGVMMPTYISSVREVDWQRVQTNFFVIFPDGVLEEAPQFHVLLTRTETEEEAAALQSAVVRTYPNVSSIDISLILDTFASIMGRVSFVIRFMALFSILTGFIVLTGAVIVSRFQRIEESVLLKTLGASRNQVFKIMTIEYLFLGLFATSTGMVLSLLGSWALAFFVFDTAFIAPPASLFIAVIVVTAATIAVGLLNSRGIYDRPPLEVLRAET